MTLARMSVLAAALTLGATMASAMALPRAGSCELTQDYGGDYVFRTLVEWNGPEATITTGSGTVQGKVHGMRAHDEGFKFSILYQDPIVGRSEMVIFQMSDSSATTYRLGIVHYTDLDNGEVAVSSIMGFEDAVCVVLR